MAKRPKDGFLVIRLQATSSAGETVAIPMLRLETTNGDIVSEVEDARGLPEWFGIIRRVDPGGTETGWIAFDAAPGIYGLRLSDGILENEQVAMVKIPFLVEASVQP